MPRTSPTIIVASLLLLAMLAVPRPTIFSIRAGAGRAVEEGLELLHSDRYEARARGLRRLVSLGELARPALLAAARSKDSETRRDAEVALREIREAREPLAVRRAEQYRALLKRGLADPGGVRPDSNVFAALTLSPDTACRVVARLAGEHEGNAIVLERAVTLLVDLNRPAAAPFLSRLLSAPDVLPSTLHLAAEGLLAFGGARQIPAIRAALRAPEPYARARAVDLLASFGGRADLPNFRREESDPAAIVRAAAAAAFGRIGSPDVAGDLRRLSVDPTAAVRSAAVLAMASVREAPARTAALSALKDPAPIVREAALRLLRLRGEPRDASAATAALHDPHPDVRERAVEAAAALGRPLPAIRTGLSDSALGVRRMALLCLERLPLAAREMALSRAPVESDPYLRDLRRELLRDSNGR